MNNKNESIGKGKGKYSSFDATKRKKNLRNNSKKSTAV